MSDKNEKSENNVKSDKQKGSKKGCGCKGKLTK
uniref:Uncharacterized protein n=1 Tax=viral metagenome TaxID=1070528 RepID=A0A6C0JS30_9ZZZZ